MSEQAGLRENLIAAALGLLEADGEEPSLRAVARAAGVSAMAPYNHFADKAELMASVADHGFAGLRDALAEADVADDPHEALIRQGIAFVEFARANPALYRLMYSPRHGSADMEAVRATYVILADRVAGLWPAHAAAVTLASRSLVQGMAAIALSDRLAPSKAEDIAVAVRLFVEGMRAGLA